MPYRALALDVDGTLINAAQKKITAKTTAALKDLQSRGVVVLLATGRSDYASTGVILGTDFIPDWRVCANGALILDSDGRTMFERRLTSTDVETICAFAVKYGFSLNFTFDDAYYVYNKYSDYVAYYTASAGDVPYLRDGTDRSRHLQSLPYGAYLKMPDSFRSELAGLCPTVKLMQTVPGTYDINRQESSFDISPYNADKRHGVAWILSRLGLGFDELVAVGDSENDADLILAAGMGVAVANAPAHIRALAGHVTGSVTEDGVVTVIERFFG